MPAVRNRSLLILSSVLFIGGMIGIIVSGYYQATPKSGRLDSQQFSSEGQRIYLTGFSSKGRIPFARGPMWLARRGGGCVACHGLDGQGGIVPMMGTEPTPAITYKALTQAEKNEDPGDEEEHPPFTEKTIKQAITLGLEPNGEELDNMMPRWSMTNEELDEIIEYLKVLGK